MKNWKALAIGLCVLFASLSFAQTVSVPLPQRSIEGGVAYSPNYGVWKINLGSAITATGSQTFLAQQGYATTTDGLTFIPFVVGEKIGVGTGATYETVQISAVSNCGSTAAPGLPATCSITATSFANSHSIGEPITSADNGIMEAVGYASSIGGGNVYFNVDCGPITLSTGGLTTTSTCFVPATFYNQGSASRVTTTITTSASWAVGVSGATSAFSTANATLTAGTTSIANQPAVALVGTTSGLTAVLITAGTSAAGAGAVHVRVWGYAPAQAGY